MRAYRAFRAIPMILPALIALLVTAAVPGSSVGFASSKGSNSLSDCECNHLLALDQDLANAVELRNRFQAEAQALDQKYTHPVSDGDRMASIAEEQQFMLHTAPKGIQAPPGYSGPSSVDYTPRNISFDNLPKYKPADQCQPSPGSKQELAKAEKGSVCNAMADAIRAHEQYHQSQCVAAGGSTAYFHKSGAEKAAEEAQAYQAQINVLQAAVDKIRTNIMQCAGGGRDR